MFFQLPHAFPLLYKKINISNDENDNDELRRSSSLVNYLNEIKEKICLAEDSWDIYKEYTNPYEYIHTKLPLPNKKSVSTYLPLSRSYFKMIELLKHFNLLDKYRSQSIKTFHLAEGPGGFTEAVINSRMDSTRICETNSTKSEGLPKDFGVKDEYYAISLINEENKYVPSWKKGQYFIKSHPNFIIDNGYDKTGNLLNMDNFTDLVERYGSKMDLITGDGGFDFSDDFNRQELCILPLLIAQICTALCMQKSEGTFILKVFDCCLKPTVDLLYLLSSFYQTVYVSKPCTSRMANSERYIVCMNFHYTNYTEYYPYLFHLMKTTMNMKTHEFTDSLRFLQLSIPRIFTSKLDEYNLILGQQQINNIFATLALIHSNNKINRNHKLDYYVKVNTSKCIYWCQKHNVPYSRL